MISYLMVFYIEFVYFEIKKGKYWLSYLFVEFV